MLGKQRIRELGQDVRKYVESLLEREPGLLAMEAGAVAVLVETDFRHAALELLGDEPADLLAPHGSRA